MGFSANRVVGQLFFLGEYLHVTGWSGLRCRGSEVPLHDLIETTVPHVLGQLVEKGEKVCVRSPQQNCTSVPSETVPHLQL